ncbi:MAG: hypothetical protein MMC23_004497 [Stictis urceolatum]|nr:hypothetical protein [Stictis urceolata]
MAGTPAPPRKPPNSAGKQTQGESKHKKRRREDDKEESSKRVKTAVVSTKDLIQPTAKASISKKRTLTRSTRVPCHSRRDSYLSSPAMTKLGSKPAARSKQARPEELGSGGSSKANSLRSDRVSSGQKQREDQRRDSKAGKGSEKKGTSISTSKTNSDSTAGRGTTQVYSPTSVIKHQTVDPVIITTRLDYRLKELETMVDIFPRKVPWANDESARGLLTAYASRVIFSVDLVKTELEILTNARRDNLVSFGPGCVEEVAQRLWREMKEFMVALDDIEQTIEEWKRQKRAAPRLVGRSKEIEVHSYG